MGDNTATVLDLEPGKVREFAAAVALPLDELRDADGALLISPTFLAIMNFVDDVDSIAAELGFDAARILHGEQEYEFEGPPPAAGMRLFATSTVTDRYEKHGSRGRLRFAVRTTEFTDAEGTVVARARMTAVETEAVDA